MSYDRNMKATFALLANAEIHNLVRKLAWDIHRKYHTGIDIGRLPPHISLKQPFDISDVAILESYLAELTGSLSPFEVTLTQLGLVRTMLDNLDTGILWLDVQETEILRQLHNRLNHDLALRIGSAPAAFDGAAYHFHMTVAIAGQPHEVYRGIHEEFSSRLVNLKFMVEEMVMFIYDDDASLAKGYMTYMVLPLGRTSIVGRLV